MKFFKVLLFIGVSVFMCSQQANAHKTDESQALLATKIAVTAGTARFNKLRGILNNALDEGMSVKQISDVLKSCATYTAMQHILTAYDLLDTVLTERNIRGKQDLYSSATLNSQETSKFDQKCNSFVQSSLQDSAVNKFSASLAHEYTGFMQETLCDSSKDFKDIVAIATLCATNAQDYLLEKHIHEASIQGYDQEFFKKMASVIEKNIGAQNAMLLRTKL